jgi:hypothetical protein
MTPQQQLFCQQVVERVSLEFNIKNKIFIFFLFSLNQIINRKKMSFLFDLGFFVLYYNEKIFIQ